MAKFMIAAFQGKCYPGNVPENLKVMKKQMEIASKAEACLIVFPELFTTGYYLEPDEMKRLSEIQDGETFQKLSKWAKELRIGVLYGYPELSGSVFYNSAMFIDSDGMALGNYRKQHLWVESEEVFTAGDSNLIVTCNGIKMGVLICYDVEFPEAVRCLALEGVELVLVPTAVCASSKRQDDSNDWTRISNILIPARALENELFVAYINYCSFQSGHIFLGRSCIYGPNGKPVVLAGGDEDTLLLGTIDTGKCQMQRDSSHYQRERRPELYSKIAAK